MEQWGWVYWGLVPGWWFDSTPLKNMKVNWGYYSQYMENKKCCKPPTRYFSINVPNEHQPTNY